MRMAKDRHLFVSTVFEQIWSRRSFDWSYVWQLRPILGKQFRGISGMVFPAIIFNVTQYYLLRNWKKNSNISSVTSKTSSLPRTSSLPFTLNVVVSMFNIMTTTTNEVPREANASYPLSIISSAVPKLVCVDSEPIADSVGVKAA